VSTMRLPKRSRLGGNTIHEAVTAPAANRSTQQTVFWGTIISRRTLIRSGSMMSPALMPQRVACRYRCPMPRLDADRPSTLRDSSWHRRSPCGTVTSNGHGCRRKGWNNDSALESIEFGGHGVEVDHRARSPDVIVSGMQIPVDDVQG
jgi:hypothetical protein